jgi:hypothetical protein
LDEIDQSLKDKQNQEQETHIGAFSFSTITSTDTFVTCQTHPLSEESIASSRNQTPRKRQLTRELDVDNIEQQCMSPESQKRVCLITPESISESPTTSGGMFFRPRRSSLLRLDRSLKGISMNIFSGRGESVVLNCNETEDNLSFRPNRK